MAYTSVPITIKDASAADQQMQAYSDGTNKNFTHSLLDNTGALISPATSGNQTTANTSLATIATAVQAATPAGTNVIGAVTSPGIVHKTAAPTVTASSAYASGNVVGTLNTLTNALRTSGGTAAIQSVIVTCKAAQTAPYDVLFFDSNPGSSTFTDKSAVAVNSADLPSLCGIAHCNDPVSLGTPQALQALNINLPLQNGSSNASLYAVIVARGTPTFSSTSDIGLSVIIAQN